MTKIDQLLALIDQVSDAKTTANALGFAGHGAVLYDVQRGLEDAAGKLAYDQLRKTRKT